MQMSQRRNNSPMQAQSGCEFTTLSLLKITATSAARRAVLAWFREQAFYAQTARMCASLTTQFCKSKWSGCSAGVREV